METKNVKNPKELKIELKLKIPKNWKSNWNWKSQRIPKNPMESIRTWPFSTSTSSTSKNPKPKRFHFVSFSFSIFSAELISINNFYYRLFATFCNILTYFVKKNSWTNPSIILREIRRDSSGICRSGRADWWPANGNWGCGGWRLFGWRDGSRWGCSGNRRRDAGSDQRLEAEPLDWKPVPDRATWWNQSSSFMVEIKVVELFINF